MTNKYEPSLIHIERMVQQHGPWTVMGHIKSYAASKGNLTSVSYYEFVRKHQLTPCMVFEHNVIGAIQWLTCEQTAAFAFCVEFKNDRLPTRLMVAVNDLQSQLYLKMAFA